MALMSLGSLNISLGEAAEKCRVMGFPSGRVNVSIGCLIECKCWKFHFEKEDESKNYASCISMRCPSAAKPSAVCLDLQRLLQKWIIDSCKYVSAAFLVLLFFLFCFLGWNTQNTSIVLSKKVFKNKSASAMFLSYEMMQINEVV